MFKVTAKAKLREQNGQRWLQYWCAGKCWSALEETTHELTESQLDALKREQDDGMPIVLISVEVPESAVVESSAASVASSPALPPWAAHN